MIKDYSYLLGKTLEVKRDGYGFPDSEVGGFVKVIDVNDMSVYEIMVDDDIYGDRWVGAESFDLPEPDDKVSISRGDLFNIEKYVDLDIGIEQVIPHVLESDQELKRLCQKFKWARKNLNSYLCSISERDE